METEETKQTREQPMLEPIMADQDLAGGVNERVACLLLLDTSSSMSGSKIDELNRGLQTFGNELKSDEIARLRAEVAIVAFGGTVRLEQDFQVAENFNAPTLSSNGGTPMGEAIEFGLKKLEERKATYRANSTRTWRPWIILITDGEPTDSWQNAAMLVRDGSQNRKFSFYAVGVDQANMECLRQIAPPDTSPKKLAETNFHELFLWLSGSLRVVSGSRPGQNINLPPTNWEQREA